jgi:predicted CoA-binding protein
MTTDDGLRDLLDLHEGRFPVPLLDDAAMARLLRETRRIAVVGASPNPARPSHDVMRYLLDAGYDCVPVTPTADEVLGRRAWPTLAEAVAATGPFGIVDVFRQPAFCAEHAREAVAAGADALWLQLGIASAEAGRIAVAGGLGVVMDRCLLVEHRRLIGRAGG